MNKCLLIMITPLLATALGCSNDELSFSGVVNRVASAGNGHTCNVRFNGTIACWGWNLHGQLGDGTQTDQPVPLQVGPDPIWVAVAAGAYHSCALRNDSWLWCWGWNEHGQLGTGTTTDQYQPLLTEAGSRWKRIAAGATHSCAIRDDKSLWCWGNNHSGQLGNGNIGLDEKSPAPEQIGAGKQWLLVQAGESHSCALQDDDSLWCWGNNTQGQLGNGTTNDQATPQALSPGTVWRTVGTGYFHTCGVRGDGSLWCWGDNQFGQLGLSDASTSSPTLEPTRVGTENDWLAVALGDYHSCARRLDNSIWCWGSNAYGQLGRGTEGDELFATPIQITSENRWIDLTAGNDHTCGLWDDESLWCWGRNDHGQLGDGTTTNRAVPIGVDYVK